MKRISPLLLELLLLTLVCLTLTACAMVIRHPRAEFMLVLTVAMLLNMGVAQLRHRHRIRTLRAQGRRRGKAAS